MRWLPVIVVLCALAACGRCGGEEREAGEAPERTLPPRIDAVARRFGELMLEKRYAAAYESMAKAYKDEVGYQGFVESVSRYRDQVQGQLTLEVAAGSTDPKELAEDPGVKLFIPEQHRARVIDEASLHFREAGEEGASWGLVMWLVEEPEGPRILQFLQED